jgi:hypothetical protein
MNSYPEFISLANGDCNCFAAISCEKKFDDSENAASIIDWGIPWLMMVKKPIFFAASQRSVAISLSERSGLMSMVGTVSPLEAAAALPIPL